MLNENIYYEDKTNGLNVKVPITLSYEIVDAYAK